MEDNNRQLAQKVFKQNYWKGIIFHLIDVLRVNIFIVDTNGMIITFPKKAKFGGKLLMNQSLGFDLLDGTGQFISQFRQQDDFLESDNLYGLSSYAIPVRLNKPEPFAYMIVGPVILNKRLDSKDYESMTREQGANVNEILNEMHDIRVLSHIMMRSVLDLLSEIIENNMQIYRDKDEMKQLAGDVLHKEETKERIDLRRDELLKNLLEVALEMTNMEAGSVMILNKEDGDLIIKVSKGLKKKGLEGSHVKLGEGISGIAAKENKSFIIGKGKSDNRIKHLLKRPEIKQSVVMPLMGRGHLYGVLNLHTKKEESNVENNIDNLQHISKLISSAF